MEYISLGTTGEKIPKIGFGTARFRGGAGVLRRAVELEAGFIDTAESYNALGDEFGAAERLVADELENVDGDFFIATKVSPANLRFDDVIAHAEASLRRLQVGKIDLYQIHGPNPEIPIGESMRAMEELVARGVIRYIGVSNFSVDEMNSAQDALKTNPLVSNQVRYNLLDREAELDVLPFCQKNGVTLIAHTPFAMGRVLSPSAPAAIAGVAADSGKSPAQIALNWLTSHPGVVAIPKTDRHERVDELAKSVGWRLDREQIAALEAP